MSIQIDIRTFTTVGKNIVTGQPWQPYLWPVASVIVSHVLVVPLLVVIATAVANTPVTKISTKSTAYRNLDLYKKEASNMSYVRTRDVQVNFLFSTILLYTHVHTHKCVFAKCIKYEQ